LGIWESTPGSGTKKETNAIFVALQNDLSWLSEKGSNMPGELRTTTPSAFPVIGNTTRVNPGIRDSSWYPTRSAKYAAAILDPQGALVGSALMGALGNTAT